MAKITLDLNRFKASGIYTVEIDASERIVVSTQTVRLVVGFSRIGPFNAPTFLRDLRNSRRIFGTIDSTLEARGSFFHRAIETCLSTGPIFALNLLPLNNKPVNEGGDAVDFRSFALASDEQNGPITRALYSSFYNKERFWFPDTEYLQATVDAKPINRGRLFNVVNLGQQRVSILIRKSVNASQYNIPADEYYDADEIPAYVYKKDYLSDYFVDVYIVRGDWTNYKVLAADPLYSKYFDLRGVKADRLDLFLSLDNITLLGSFTGCVIPNFLDNNGANQSIDTIVNNNVALTGLFLNINEDALSDYDNSSYAVDMVGHNLIDTTDDTIDFLSYNTPIKNVLEYASKNGDLDTYELTQQTFDPLSGSVAPYVESFPYGGNKGKFNNVLVIPKPIPSDTTFTPNQWSNLLDTLNTNSLFRTFGTGTILDTSLPNDYVKVDNVIDTGTALRLVLSSPLHINDNYEAGSAGAESNYVNETVAALVPTAADTIEVPTGTIVDFVPVAGDIVLIETAGYAKYFELSTWTPGATDTIVVKNTGLTTAGPYYQSKYCVEGFPADEFSAILQPTDIKVTVFAAASVNNDDLVPDLTLGAGNTFGYIINPASSLDSIEGLGQSTAFEAAANEVNVYNETTSTDLGTWYMYDGSIPAFTLDSSNVNFGNVCIQDNTGTNTGPFTASGNTIRITLPGGQTFTGVDNSASTDVLESTDVAKLGYIESYPGAKISQHINGALLVDGDRVKYGTGSSEYNYLNVDQVWSISVDEYSRVAYGLNGTRVREYTDTQLLTRANSTFASLDNTYIDATQYTTGVLGEVAFAAYSSLAKNITTNYAIESPGLFDGGKKFKLNETNAALVNIGDFVVNNAVDAKLTRIVGKVKKYDPATGVPYYEYSTLETPLITTASGVDYISVFTPIQKFADRYDFTTLSGFTMTDFHLPGTPAQLEKILSILETTNIGKTLASRDVITFRYVVDTFNGGLEPQMGPKQYLSRLAKNRQQCMALLNAPSISEFVESTDPRFTDLPDANAGNPKPVLVTEYISTGGNLSLGPSFTWGLPDEENGAKYIGVFTPNVILRENGKNISVPPSAHVSNNFVRKFINGEPYAIVAGPRRGVLSDPKFVKMEYDFLLEDREFLEPAGLNPIVVVRNVGPMIFANQTAYQRTLSAFNNLHVRDLLITIEEAVIEILQNYLFEFNDASTRLEIATLVETYLDVVRNGGGIYEYDVIMDESNNTPEIIDQNFGILDIGIEPARGLQKFVNRITVLKTGGIASGGFAPV